MGIPAEVVIHVTFHGNGRPAVRPDECHVDHGAGIVWRTDDGVDVPFEIDFEGESAAGRDAPRHLRSESGQSRQRVRLTAGNAPRRYKYAIEANGVRVDPAIIIDR